MIETAAVIGAGLMGKGIAKHLAAMGCKVILIDSNPEQLAQAKKQIETPDVILSTDIKECYHVDYAIEAIVEDLNLKKKLFAELNEILGEKTILASNTSSLLIRDLAKAVHLPERFIGVHYNNPADLNPIVEIIPTDYTNAMVTDLLINCYMNSGKRAVLCRDTSGFVLNRQSLPYINEAVRCLDIASPKSIDEIARRELGTNLGPFAVIDLVGLKVMATASKNLGLLGAGYLPAKLLLQKATDEAGNWNIDAETGLHSNSVDAVRDRLLGAILFSGKDILDQSLCSRNDLHLICLEALGYQRSSPDLLDQLPRTEISRLIENYLSAETD